MSAARAGKSAVNIGGTYCKGLCAGRRARGNHFAVLLPGDAGLRRHCDVSERERERASSMALRRRMVLERTVAAAGVARR